MTKFIENSIFFRREVEVVENYRTFKKIGIKVFPLGFGAMRLPIIGGNEANIDEKEAIKMIRYGIDHGINYVDTAYPYHKGNSEILVGKALKNGYRNKTYLATKLPTWLLETKKDMDKYLTEQLKKLDVEHIDFYLIHSLRKHTWERAYKLGVLEWAEKMKEKGYIRFLGFSFHDEFPVFKEIIDAYDEWDFCQIQYNYMDINFQAGRKGLKYAASKGISVIVMEPLRGGKLANPPLSVKEVFDSYHVKRTPVEWALLWVWNHPEVALLLSGMSTMEQVKQNVETAKHSGIGILSEEELNIIKKAREEYLRLTPIDCTSCNYCMPCPFGVNIPGNFAIYNNAVRYNNSFKDFKWEYDALGDGRASSCTKCGECEPKCPQNLHIRDLLEMVKDTFESL